MDRKEAEKLKRKQHRQNDMLYLAVKECFPKMKISYEGYTETQAIDFAFQCMVIQELDMMLSRPYNSKMEVFKTYSEKLSRRILKKSKGHSLRALGISTKSLYRKYDIWVKSGRNRHRYSGIIKDKSLELRRRNLTDKVVKIYFENCGISRVRWAELHGMSPDTLNAFIFERRMWSKDLAESLRCDIERFVSDTKAKHQKLNEELKKLEKILTQLNGVLKRNNSLAKEKSCHKNI